MNYYFVLSFLATVCKTVRPMLSDRCPVCPVCLSVCLSVVYCGQTVDGSRWNLARRFRRSRPRPHCVRWEPSSPKRGTAPNFRRMYVVAKRLDASKWNLTLRYALAQAILCYMGTQLPQAPTFRPISLWHGRPSQQLLSSCWDMRAYRLTRSSIYFAPLRILVFQHIATTVNVFLLTTSSNRGCVIYQTTCFSTA